MDHFERQLAHLMRTTEERVSFDPAHRDRLRSGVRARRRMRAAQAGVGSVLAVGGLGLGLLLLPGAPDRVEPSAPLPRPASSPAASPSLTPSPPTSPSPASSASRSTSPTPSDSATTGPPATPTYPPSTGTASHGTEDPTTAATTPTATASNSPTSAASYEVEAPPSETVSTG
ncbi:hypothetical protein [Streptomyces sp. NPDC087294]|uniref:hypothetical protein n=1 Tax=Streptomyces sp. NPDC087294 TaxID=3365777 RepID=UPI00380D0760